MSVVKLGRVPDKVRTLDELFGAVRMVQNIQNVVMIVEDDGGVTTMVVHGTTMERMNWLLDRAKRTLHKDSP